MPQGPKAKSPEQKLQGLSAKTVAEKCSKGRNKKKLGTKALRTYNAKMATERGLKGRNKKESKA